MTTIATPAGVTVVSLGDVTVREFVSHLSTSEPTPGGGAASALAGALAAALVSMVAELSLGRSKLEPYAATIRRSHALGRRLSVELLRLGDEDAAAFEAFMAAWRQPKIGGPEERREALSIAACAAAEPPRLILGFCVVIADAAARLAGRSNPNLASDLVVASRLVEAAAHGAAENVYTNLPNISNPAEVERLRTEARRMVFDVERLSRLIRREAAKGTLRLPERRPPEDPPERDPEA